jgi:hypothetical protein
LAGTWPWSLGFGKAARMGSNDVALEDADRTIHTSSTQVYSFPVGPFPAFFTTFVSHSTDGTMIDSTFHLTFGVVTDGFASYPNGTVVEYGAVSDGGDAAYPTRITDAHGNFITIAYRNNVGPHIDTIQDTLGRIIHFHYDVAGLLTAITAPGLQGGTRTAARLDYSDPQLQTRFYFGNVVDTWNPHPKKLDALYSPGSSTGYWFGDADSYSTYGMIAKVSQRHDMRCDAPR